MKFQSTPPVSGRRCTRNALKHSSNTCFNPRPPFPGGDASCSLAASQTTWGFNPRPPFPGGDAEFKTWLEGQLAVSIHAPRFREAMPSISSHWPIRQKFQSTPPVSGRRCVRTLGRYPHSRRFNPRPPFPGGDAQFDWHRDDLGTVSIHAPRFREAMPSPVFSSALPSLFQSTPPVSGRRCSSPVTTGSIRTKDPHCANLFIPEQKTSYANSAPSGKPHQIRQKRGARTYREKHVHLGFAQAHRTSGASKSVARKKPCSRTS